MYCSPVAWPRRNEGFRDKNVGWAEERGPPRLGKDVEPSKGATGSVLRPRAFDVARAHGVGVPNPWHPEDIRPGLVDRAFLNLTRKGERSRIPARTVVLGATRR